VTSRCLPDHRPLLLYWSTTCSISTSKRKPCWPINLQLSRGMLVIYDDYHYHYYYYYYIFVHVLFCVWLYIACMCSIVTWWGGPGGIEAWFLGPLLLQCFDAVGWVIWPVKPVPDMTYNVFSGTLNPTQSFSLSKLSSVHGFDDRNN